MKQANAVRVGKEVSLSYMGLWLSFQWTACELFLATDADGTVWAYPSEPIRDFEGFYSAEYEGVPVHRHGAITLWQQSIVQYTIK